MTKKTSKRSKAKSTGIVLARRGDATRALASDSSAAGKRLTELLDLIQRKKDVIAESFYEIGLALREIKQKKLYGQLGYKSFNALLAGHEVIGHTQAGKLIGIVNAMTRDQALQLGGVEKAYAAARLVAATPEPDTVGALLASGVKTGSHGRGRRKLSAMSTQDVEAMSRAARRKTHPKSEAEKAAENGARLARETLRAAGFRVIESRAGVHARQWRVHLIVVPPKE